MINITLWIQYFYDNYDEKEEKVFKKEEGSLLTRKKFKNHIFIVNLKTLVE